MHTVTMMKVKINGRKCRVRLMEKDDIIDKMTWFTVDTEINPYTRWFISKAQGDRVSEHPNRIYIRNCSPLYKVKI